MSGLRDYLPVSLLKWLNRAPRDGLLSGLRESVQFEPTPDRWIFVLGCYNSGTTLLDRVLQSHPDIHGLPEEGVALTDQWSIPGEHGWPRLWFKCREQLENEPSSPENVAERIKRDWSLFLPADVLNVVQKSIVNSLHLEFLESCFQPAYFIHIVRNGYAVAEGIRRKANLDKYPNPRYEEEYPLELTARQWKESLDLIDERSGSLSRYKRIRYEDVTERTDRVLEELTDFLGIDPFGPSVKEKTWSIQQYDEPIRNLNRNNLANLSGEEVALIREEIGPALREEGYESPPVD